MRQSTPFGIFRHFSFFMQAFLRGVNEPKEEKLDKAKWTSLKLRFASFFNTYSALCIFDSYLNFFIVDENTVVPEVECCMDDEDTIQGIHRITAPPS